MFKQVLVMIFTSIVSYSLTVYLLTKNYRRFYFINGIIKYPLRCTIKNATYINGNLIKNLDNFIFYSNESIIDGDNYIYDKRMDHYYLIEPGYYYYINKSRSDLKLHFNPNSFIFYLKIK